MSPSRGGNGGGAWIDAYRVLLIVGVNLRRIGRDRIFPLTILVLPLIVIAVIGFAVDSNLSSYPAGVSSSDRSALARMLVETVDSAPQIDVVTYPDEAALRRAVARDDVAIGLQIPAGYGASLEAGEPKEIEVAANATRPAALAAQSLVVSRLLRFATIVQASSFAAREVGASFDDGIARATEIVDSLPQGVRDPGRDVVAGHTLGFSYLAPANLVLFVFITGMTTSAMYVSQRRLGISSRLRAGPAGTGVMLLGECASRFLVAAFQGALIAVASAVLFGVDWGDWATVSLLIGVVALSGAALGLALGSIAPTFEHAVSIGPPVGITLGMLGGCLWPLDLVPRPMQITGHATPHSWAMDAFLETMSQGAGPSGIWPQLLVLSLFAALLMAFGGVLLKRSLVAPGAGVR